MIDHLPGIGGLTVDEYDEWSTPELHVTLLGEDVSFAIVDYDPQQTDKIVACSENFRALPAETLSQATNEAYACYQDFYQAMVDDEDEDESTLAWLPKIDEPAKVWEHIQLGDDPTA